LATEAPAPTPDPAGESLWIPASPAPEAVVDAPAADPAPVSEPPPATDTTPAPTSQTDQEATVESTGTGVGNSGANTAVGNETAGGVQAQPCPTSGTQIALICTTTPTGAAGVTSGNANAQGTNSTGGIAQITNIAATGNGQVDVLQVALIINIGVGISNSGANAAGASGGDSLGVAGQAGIGTGNANVTGLLGNTQIVQGVTVVGGSASDQSVTVVNIGIGIGNTGLNLAAGSVLGGGDQEVAAGGAPGNGSAAIGTGNTNAAGDNSGSLIMQIVTVTAADDGSITVTQRAVIINFGLALANSGGNTALSAMNGLPDAQRTMIEGLIAALFGLDPAVLFGGGSAAIGTGNANAIGNQSQSGIVQAVTGSVTGTDAATADQSAWIGNFGAALANSGLNGAAGALAVLPDGSPMASAEQMVSRFLALLSNPDALANGDTDMADALDLGSALLALRGDISATETLAGLDEGEAWESSDGGVRIRPITGVLNIGISLANSGENVAESLVTGSNLDALEPTAARVLGTASILTGPVDVMGLRSTVCVTQIIGDSADFDEACPAPTPPEEPPNPQVDVEVEGKQVQSPTAAVPASLPVEVEVEGKTVQAGSLPLTGGSLQLEALFGLALTGGGILIQRRARRTRSDHTVQ
ncbi:MAG: hypothetical protein ACXW2C_11355, partial [Acidimicrobiia bacterium]